ncbi:TetR/AcrR family transcriptional regulator [Ramlibacter henchirensis]|uniref:TetR/AcrR family transcriptional regulator n=1 Tax=Ramlibacter henchirensis TaxID=204072 RepID=A0A4Z0C4S6_9BURK|nr:TetR/AcrR family transcriptional regulator [Ramlibacter henchirensis]TFZ05942.1 TetR/AcrR family transcriptional regulator [Ramlibacter henchirensis]
MPAKSQAKPPPVPEDRRRRRSITTRRKIADALLSLVSEGIVRPTAEQVATRAQVGLRTVFRHFEDMETLYREVIRGVDTVVLPVVEGRRASADWKEELRSTCGTLAHHYERLAASYLVSQVHRHHSAYLDAQLRRYSQLQGEALRRQLPPVVLADQACVDALSLLLSMDAWVHLRREQGLTFDAALQAIERATAGLAAAFAGDGRGLRRR